MLILRQLNATHWPLHSINFHNAYGPKNLKAEKAKDELKESPCVPFGPSLPLFQFLQRNL